MAFPSSTSDTNLMVESPQSSQGLPPPSSWDTLDEPIQDTILRDLRSILTKLKLVIKPTVSEQEVYINVCKNWDLWGPFIFYTYIAFSLNNCEGDGCHSRYHESNFSSLFVVLWLGNIVIGLNMMLVLKNDHLKSIQPDTVVTSDLSVPPPTSLSAFHQHLSLFQLMCLIGYVMAIPSLAILIIQMFKIFVSDTHHSQSLFYEKFFITIVLGFALPVVCVMKLTTVFVRNHGDRSFLIFYPVFLFFFILSLYLFTYV